MNRRQLTANDVVVLMMEASEPDLSTHLGKLGEEERQKAYRRLARTLHPDKNNHPQAKTAFQKLQSILS